MNNQPQLFKQAGHTSDQSAAISYTVEADAAYEVICEALMKGSSAFDAVITTAAGHAAEIRVCEIAGDGETIRDVIRRAETDLERDRDIMRYEDEWNPHLNDSWW